MLETMRVDVECAAIKWLPDKCHGIHIYNQPRLIMWSTHY